MSKTKRRALVWIGVVVAIAGAATAAMWPKPLDVEVTAAARGRLRSTVDAEARTRVRSRFVVTAPVTGRLSRIALRPGDVVRRGEVLARVAPLPLDAASAEAARARVAAAEAGMRDADARARQSGEALALAARTLARFRAIEAAGGASRQQREQAELDSVLRAEDAAAAATRVRAATAELWAARSALPAPASAAPTVPVRAPSDGRVLQVPEESERIVSAGTTVVEIGRDTDLEIVADVLSEDAVRIPPAAPVELMGWGGDVLLTGTVRRIEPAARTRVSALGVEEQRVNVIIAPARTPPALGDGFRLDAHIVVWEGRSVVTVPASAVFTTGQDARVFVVERGRARERAVTAGHRSDADVEVIDGLDPGELVVLFPSDRVREGARVRYEKPPGAP